MELIYLLYLMQKDNEKFSFIEYEKIRLYCMKILGNTSKERSIEIITLLLAIKEYAGMYSEIIVSKKQRTFNLKVLKEFIHKYSKLYRKRTKIKN